MIARDHASFTRVAARLHAGLRERVRMSMLEAVLLASLCGCAIVPGTRTTTRSLGLRDGAVVEGADRGISLAASVRGGVVTVHASHTLACTRQIVELTEVTRSPHLAFHASEDPRARFFGVLVAPIVVPVSLLVSVAAVAAREDEVTQQVRLDHTVAMACTKPAAHESLEVALPSGASLHVIADGSGTATIGVPDSEPYRGTLVARAGTAETKIDYALPVPAVTAARDAIKTCAADHAATGALRVEITVDALGAPRHLHLDRSDAALVSCIGTALAPIRFPDSQRAMTVVVPVALPSS